MCSVAKGDRRPRTHKSRKGGENRENNKKQKIMKTKQRTVAVAEVLDVVKSLIKSGYKELQLGQNRVPVGSSERLNIYARRWCGEWSGYQSFCAAVLYK